MAIEITINLIQLRRDTEANFTSVDPILAAGEPAYSTDTNGLKIGDGTSNWSSLSYLTGTGGGGGTWGSIVGTLSNQTDLQAALDNKAGVTHTHTTVDITDLSSYTGLDARYYTEGEMDTFLDTKAIISTVAPPQALDIARWSSGTTLEGLTYAELKTDLNYQSSEIAVSPAVNSLTNIQAVLEDHESRIDVLAGGGADGNGIYDGNGSLGATTTVNLNSNQLNFDQAGTSIVMNSGRLGVATEVFGPSRLGDSEFQAANIDVQSINFKDDSLNTVQAIFQNPTFTVTTHKNFASTVNVNSFASLEGIKNTDNAESTLGLRIDYTNSEFYVTDLGVQDYSPSAPGTLVEDVHFQVLINGGSAVAKPYWFGRYDETTYTTIFDVNTSNVLNFENNPTVTGGTATQLMVADGSTADLSNLVTLDGAQTITGDKRFGFNLGFNGFGVDNVSFINFYDTDTTTLNSQMGYSDDAAIDGFFFKNIDSGAGGYFTLKPTQIEYDQDIQAAAFKRVGGTSDQVMLGDGSTTSLAGIGTGSGTSYNDIYIDTPTGTVDGVNTTFTVGQSEYGTGKLIVFVNGIANTAGAGLTETTPASGIFTLDAAPLTGAQVIAYYGTTTNSSADLEARLTNENKTIEVLVTADRAIVAEDIEISSGANIGKKVFLTPDTNGTTRVLTLDDIGEIGDIITVSGNIQQETAVLQVNEGTATIGNLTGANDAITVTNTELCMLRKLASNLYRVDGSYTEIEVVTVTNLYSEQSNANATNTGGIGSWVSDQGGTPTAVTEDSFPAIQIFPTEGQTNDAAAIPLEGAGVSTWSGGQITSLTPGATYQVTVDVKNDDAALFQVWTGSSLSNADGISSAGTFTERVFTFIVPGGGYTAGAALGFRADNNDGNGTTWIKNLRIVQI